MEIERMLARKRSQLAGLLETRKDILAERTRAQHLHDEEGEKLAETKLEHITGRIMETAEAINFMKNQAM